MKRKIWIFSLTMTGALLILFTACKKKDNNSNNNIPTPPVVKPYIARYYVVGASQWALQFFEGDSVYYWVGSNYVKGTYQMLTSTHVKISMGYFGEGDFVHNFDTLIEAGEHWAK